MAIRKVTADKVYTVSGSVLEKAVLVLEEDKIMSIDPINEHETGSVEEFKGAMVPSFVNAHCHLELSHLLGQFPEKAGLPEFLIAVTNNRSASEAEIEDAMKRADEEIWNTGTSFVGDISNRNNSYRVKADSKLGYHTFIELLGMAIDPTKVPEVIAGGEELFKELVSMGLKGSLAPHAPYSASPKHLQTIASWCNERELPSTIHMQETPSEEEFFKHNESAMDDLYRSFNVDVSPFKVKSKNSLTYTLEHFTADRFLLIHNTLADAEDVRAGIDAGATHCFCPRANLYIEDQLPDVPMFVKEYSTIVLGTDSLSSNHDLNLLNEMITIQSHFPEIDFETVLKWATKNGAEFFGKVKLGSIEVGKKPGLVLIEGMEEGRLSTGSTSRRII